MKATLRGGFFAFLAITRVSGSLVSSHDLRGLAAASHHLRRGVDGGRCRHARIRRCRPRLGCASCIVDVVERRCTVVLADPRGAGGGPGDVVRRWQACKASDGFLTVRTGVAPDTPLEQSRCSQQPARQAHLWFKVSGAGGHRSVTLIWDDGAVRNEGVLR